MILPSKNVLKGYKKEVIQFNYCSIGPSLWLYWTTPRKTFQQTTQEWSDYPNRKQTQ
jgi:hypothetical protein